ncbi:hypothetical protein [Paenibacillus ihuae]|uniref:hypothetical protein n=1 Tax=Paenibacillus ihuae TaxID=1232431 RepID=UPI0006D559BC|nr:hypothetical protein [Paenibacillus ihuae]
MMKTQTASYNGGSLSVSDFPVKQCECDTVISLSDGVLIDGYKLLLERHGIIGKVVVSLGKLKERYPRPMDLVLPYGQTR